MSWYVLGPSRVTDNAAVMLSVSAGAGPLRPPFVGKVMGAVPFHGAKLG